jgi:hypothetical protein
VQKIRRCHDDRWDFTSEDGNVFPIMIRKDGQRYGFCPAKVTWDDSVLWWYRMLTVCAETNQLPNGEPVVYQSVEWIELLSWFLPVYDQMKFKRNLEMIFGSGENSKQNALSRMQHGRKRRANR